MSRSNEFYNVAINVKSLRLLRKLLHENPRLEQILRGAQTAAEALSGIRSLAWRRLESSPHGIAYFRADRSNWGLFSSLEWRDYAAIRILDYVDYADREYTDLNLVGRKITNNPFKRLWLAVAEGRGGGQPAFFEDMIHLFRQFSGRSAPGLPSSETVRSWMTRFPSGLDPRVVALRAANRDRIIDIIIDKMETGIKTDSRYRFEAGLSRQEKRERVQVWWDESLFHLRFAVRSPDLLNEMLDSSLEPDTMRVLRSARGAGIPFFVNPYYLSLLNVKAPEFAVGADLAIRDYVLYSKQLVEEYGRIVAWEKEDAVEPGRPNAAGWVLPSHHNVHRRYPEVAILIPDSMGRACGGLCASCQRMYDFQSGYLNFDLEKLKPKESWRSKLERLLKYFEEDSQLRDVLITGGDAFMSSDRTLKHILTSIYDMAIRKRQANRLRPHGEKYAELVRVRLGTRLPAYLPQRVTPEFAQVLREFKTVASKIGIRQFVVQTHFESPMEITPEARLGVERLISAGWTVTNQLVYTAAASRRGHTARLRQALNDIGVLPYYTFTVKGYMENKHNFVPNARSVQEQLEEKALGRVPPRFLEEVRALTSDAENIVDRTRELRARAGVPFIATDRNVLNLPGVGKSLTFRVVGITREGRRILEFDHDSTRVHSPIIDQMGKVVVIESKSISEYLEQLSAMGEDVEEYEGLFGYSLGETEARAPMYEYPAFDYKVTNEFTNLVLPGGDDKIRVSLEGLAEKEACADEPEEAEEGLQDSEDDKSTEDSALRMFS